MENHERFHSRISSEDDRYFEVIDKEEAQQIVEVSHPSTYRKELEERIVKYLTSDLEVDKITVIPKYRRPFGQRQLKKGDGASRLTG